MAPVLAKLDDMAGHGELNPLKKWWWGFRADGRRGLCAQQAFRECAGAAKESGAQMCRSNFGSLSPAHLAPHPYPYPALMDREAGIEAYQAMITAETYQVKLANGAQDHLHVYQSD